jgi:SAM-dependent methyltransferase
MRKKAVAVPLKCSLAKTGVRNDNAAFWFERLRTYGHTGWSDRVIYAYDQLERLGLVKEFIAKLDLSHGHALDFGCGTGDFSRLLLGMDFEVCGYDPFVRPAISSKRFFYVSDYRQIPFSSKSVDLALSVTVLDHIVEQAEVCRALQAIRSCLRDRGVVLMVEYGLDAADDRERWSLKNDYQSFRTVREWDDLLRVSGLELAEVWPFPHPFFCPSVGYQAYVRSPLVRGRRLLSRFRLLSRILDSMVRWQATRIVASRQQVLTAVGSSPLKLFRCTPCLNS